jgi:hypothetical protein
MPKVFGALETLETTLDEWEDIVNESRNPDGSPSVRLRKVAELVADLRRAFPRSRRLAHDDT